MKGIVVLEGADGTGKTTLARRLVEKHGAFYIHNGLWPNMWQRHLATVDLAIKKSQTQLVVVDRLYLSEQVYGAVFRGGPVYDLGARCLDRMLQRHGAMTVLCVRDNQAKHAAHFEQLKTERPEKFNSIAKVAKLYAQLARGDQQHRGKFYLDQLIQDDDTRRRVDVTTYDMDTNGINLDEFCGQLVSMVEFTRTEALPGQFDARRPNLTGNHCTARYLFVGEELSPRACPRSPPFLWGDGDPSAANWLNATLRALKFDETLAVWTNAKSPDDWLPTLRERLSTTVRVIALGRVAQERVTQLGFPNVRAVPHPQWARRFQARTPEVYRKVLREVLCDI